MTNQEFNASVERDIALRMKTVYAGIAAKEAAEDVSVKPETLRIALESACQLLEHYRSTFRELADHVEVYEDEENGSRYQELMCGNARLIEAVKSFARSNPAASVALIGAAARKLDPPAEPAESCPF